MLDISIEKALTKVGSGFILAILLAERAKELLQGAPPLVETEAKDPRQIAMQEICEGKITYSLSQGNNE
jgi:DNA-directed RNA polymerase subunit omega